MSESEITITARFPNSTSAAEVEKILKNAEMEISSAWKNGKEIAFHDYLYSAGLTKGMAFDSYWLPSYIKRENETLFLEFFGSPSGGSKEQPDDDLVIWLKLFGAEDVSGELVIDSGGDVEEIKF